MPLPRLSAIAELLKPITWFPPMWAFGCGVVASGVSTDGRWLLIVAGVLLAGPFVCASSQAVNDWFDRHVDAINEPQRPIPSGRLPGRWGLYIAIAWTLLSLALGSVLGPVALLAACVGLLLAWAYSAPPVRLKRNGWWGNSACALCYEGLAWLTGAAVMAAGSIGLLQEVPFAITLYRYWRAWLFYVAVTIAGLIFGFGVFIAQGADLAEPWVQVVHIGLFVVSPILFTWLGRVFAAGLDRTGAGRGLQLPIVRPRRRDSEPLPMMAA